MANSRKRLEQDLKAAVSRLRLGGAMAIAELPRAIGDSAPLADEVDWIQANESREIAFATRERLLARVHRLAAAIERMREGEYGVCIECSERISPARLDAMPEVQTCLRCQENLERLGRHGDRGPGVFDTDHADHVTKVQLAGRYAAP